jgi:methylated-DNA-[protein]-cysteine S-methyltransferase
MSEAAYEIVDAPWGPIHLAATQTAVVALSHLVPTDLFVTSLERRFGTIGPARGRADGRLARAAAEQVEEYLRGSRRTFDLPLELGPRAAWDVAVLEGVAAVPWGEATSYGRVARRIGRPGAARAVGGAVGRNPIGLLIPCHRVLAGDGSLGGYGGAWWGSREALLEIKRELLRLEGIEVPVARLFD